MDILAPEYISLDCLAVRLRLPRKYLRKLAVAGDIPSLRVGRWLRFDEASVRAALIVVATSRKPAAQGPEPTGRGEYDTG